MALNWNSKSIVMSLSTFIVFMSTFQKVFMSTFKKVLLGDQDLKGTVPKG